MVATIANPLIVAAPALPRAGTPFRASEQAPHDHLSIVSPFKVGLEPASGAVRAPVPAPLPSEENKSTVSLVQRIAIAGLSGMALLGAFGATGCAASPNPPEVSRAQRVRTGLVPADEEMPAAEQQPQQSAPAQGTPKRVRVLGQDMGGQDERSSKVEWVTYQGTYKGESYEIEYPKGWKVGKTFYGLAVVNMSKPSEFVTFQWRQAAGNMSTQGLLQMIMHEAQAGGVQVNSQRQQPTQQTPQGAVYTMDADVSYVAEGVPVRGNFVVAVANAQGYFWMGNVIATQTTQQDYAADQPVLQHIASSMTQK